MKGVERINAVIVHLNQRARFIQYNLYAMNIDWENMNCYNYRRFGHMTRNYRNRGIGDRIKKERRLEYRERRMIEEENG